jgi:iron complex outermembrane receptor protein
MVWTAGISLLLASASATLPSPDIANPDAPAATVNGVLPAHPELAQEPFNSRQLLSMSLEELLAMEVTSVAKKPQRATDSAASVYVISQEDINRSGARQLSDLFRMVPGLDVNAITPNITSVTARGFASSYSVNTLVMIDGAAVYSSSIAGMFWDQALVPLQDIERIEIIHGPGGTLWGSNATNGIINIITRQSVDTQGTRASTKAGPGLLRSELAYGRQLSDRVGLRVYGSYHYDRGVDALDGHTFDDWRRAGQIGARLDFAPTTQDSIVALAELGKSVFMEPGYMLAMGPTGLSQDVISRRQRYSTYQLLTRWHHTPSQDLDLTAQAYYNRYERTLWGSQMERNLFDASLEGRWRATRMHELNFGLTLRQSQDSLTPGPMLRLLDGHHTDRWLTGYVQDEARLWGENLRLTLGSKFEINNFTPLILQPSARLFWRPGVAGLGLWGAVTGAMRTPQLRERDMQTGFPSLQTIPGIGTVPMLLVFSGGNQATSERLTAYEAGLRAPLGRLWALDLSLFYNRYSHLNTADTSALVMPGTPNSPFPMGVVLNVNVGDHAHGEARGGELLLKGQLSAQWQVEASWSYNDLTIAVDPGYTALSSSLLPDGQTSPHQWRLKSNLDMTDSLSLDATLHYVSRSKDKTLAPHTDLGLRLAWRPRGNLEVALVGNNLLKTRHQEFVQQLLPFPQVAVPRTLMVEAKVRL